MLRIGHTSGARASTAHAWRLLAFMASALVAVSARGADIGHVAILRHGSASYTLADSREELARQFYQSHTDSYDFLIVLPAFPADLGAEVQGLHSLVRNDVQGAGKPIVDLGSAFGSPHRLQGFIDVASLSPGSPYAGLDQALYVVAHEVAHQWSAEVRYRGSDGQFRSDLLGESGNHWSFFLDSDASVLYGSKWIEAGPGSFKTAESVKRYSTLDLYLMGLAAPVEVPPLRLLRPSPGEAHPPDGRPPADSTVVAATVEAISFDQVVAAMGPRIPAAEGAQKSFRAAFALLLAPGQAPTQAQVEFVDAVRREWANRFFFMTRGRAVMDTSLAEVAPGAVAAQPSVAFGIDWLLAQQAADGSWADHPATTIRETQLAVEALTPFATRADASAAASRAGIHLAAASSTNVDTAARRVLGLAASRQPTGPAVATLEKLLDRVQVSGIPGAGLAPGYEATPFDTALAAQALQVAAGNPVRRDALLASLETYQALDGAWPFTESGPGRIEPTTRVLSSFRAMSTGAGSPLAVERALAALETRRTIDGAYVDDQASTGASALAFLTLAEWDRLDPVAASQTSSLLLGRQRNDGSWDGSVYQTAVALRALRVALTPNLAVVPGSVAVTPGPIQEGVPVTATVLVRNTGYVPSGDFLVRGFDSAGVPFGPGVVVPSIAPGNASSVMLLIDTSGHGGSTQLFIVVDPGGAIDELRKDDNRASALLDIPLPPQQADLFVLQGSVLAVPGSIDRLPQDVVVSALIGNLGRTPVVGTRVGLWVGGVLVSSATIDVAGLSSREIAFPATVAAGSGVLELRVAIDIDGTATEARKDNNVALGALPVVSSADFAVSSLSVSPAPAAQGQDVIIAYQVRNSGTAQGSGTVEIDVLDGSGFVVARLPARSILVAPGETQPGQTVWRAGVAGALKIRVEVVAPADLRPADNAALASLVVEAATVVNLAMGPGDLTLQPSPPLQGKENSARAMVRNIGGSAAGPFDVAFFLGDPAAGGVLLGRQALAGLGAGSTVVASVPFTPATTDPQQLVAQVDGANAVADIDRSDNVATLLFQPLALPDLTVAEADIRVDGLLRPGTTVSVAVDVHNGGGQPVQQVPVALYLGAPETGGALLGSVGLPAIAAGDMARATFTWRTAAARGASRLVAVVNADRAIAEGSFADNRAERSVMVDDAPLVLSERYFSPNGDGVKDSTELYYRLATAEAVEVRVEDGAGIRVRTLGSAATSTGSLSWDGRDERGRIVGDGDYSLALFAGGGASALGRLAVVVDTNRSPLQDSVGTPWWTDEWLSDVPVAPMPDESGVLVHRSETQPDRRVVDSWFALPLDGGDPRELARSDPGKGCTVPAAVSPDGTQLACHMGFALGILTLQTGEFAPKGDASVFLPPVFSPDGRYLLVPASSLYDVDLLDVATGVRTQLFRSDSGIIVEYAFAPDGGSASIVDSSGGLWVAALDGSPARVVVPPGRIGEVDPIEGFRGPWWSGSALHGWLSDAATIAYSDAGDVVESWDAAACDLLGAYQSCFVGRGAGVRLVDAVTGAQKSYFTATDLESRQFSAGRTSVAVSPIDGAIAFPFSPEATEPSDVRWMDADGAGAPTYLTSASPNFGGPILQWSTQGTFLLERRRLLSSRANMHVALRVARKPGGGFVLQGTATDANFEGYEVAARPAGASAAGTVVARSAKQVVNGPLGEWVPTRPGVYELILTARDLAGNTRSWRSLVAWGNAPTLSNVLAELEYFSPNGDGALDSVQVSYHLSEPHTSELLVKDQAGNLVRRIPITQLQAGDYQVAWSGTTDAGDVARDGQYVGALESATLEFTVDTIAPRAEVHVGAQESPAEFSARPLKAMAPDGRSVTIPTVVSTQTWISDDENPWDWEYQEGSGSPLTWVTVDAGKVGASGPAKVGGERKVKLDEVRGRTWRMYARDVAGNEALSAELRHTERLFVVAGGSAAALDPINGFLMVDGVPTPRIDLLKALPDGGGDQPVPFVPQRWAFALGDSVGADIVGYSLLYQAPGGAAPRSGDVEILGPGLIAWDATTIPEGAYLIKVVAHDQLGRDFSAEPFWLRPGWVEPSICTIPSPAVAFVMLRSSFAAPDAPRIQLFNSETGELETTVWAGEAPTDHPELPGRVYLASMETSIYPRCVHRLTYSARDASGQLVEGESLVDVCGTHTWYEGDQASSYLHVESTHRRPVASIEVLIPGQEPRFLAALGRESPVIKLANVNPAQVRVVTTFADGSRWLPTDSPDFRSCKRSLPPETELEVLVKVSRLIQEFPPACVWRPSRYSFDFELGTPAGPIAGVRVTALPTAGGLAIPISSTIARSVDGLSASAVGTFTTDGWVEGAYLLVAEETDGAGAVKRRLAGLPFVADENPPAVAIRAPSAGALVCPVRRQSPDGRSSPWLPVEGHLTDRYIAGEAATLRTPDGRGFDLSPLRTNVDGVLGGIEVAGMKPGPYQLALSVEDHGGYACGTIDFRMDPSVELGQLALTPALISPDGDGIVDGSSMSFVLDQDSQVRLEAAPVDGGATRHLLIDGTFHAGPNAFAWSGLTLMGDPLVDGKYRLIATALSPCGNSDVKETAVEIDTTPPIARIDQPPVASAPLGPAVVGEATDANLEEFTLSLGPSGGLGPWVVLASGPAAQGGTLGMLPPGLAAGNHSLRLVVRDSVGHTSVAYREFVVPPSEFVDYFAASPPAVSPNGDGVQDSATVLFGLLAPAHVALEIAAADGAVAGTPQAPTPASIGPHEVLLDAAALAGIADGLYSLRLTAVDGTAFQQLSVPLLVDRGPPDITLRTPAVGATVPGTVQVLGAINDLSLASWSLFAAGGAGTERLVVSGRQAIDGALAALQGLPEGPNRIRVHARDVAGNERDVTVNVISDTQAPGVRIVEPLDGTMLSGRSGPAFVRLAVSDDNLQTTAIHLVRGATTRTLLSVDGVAGADASIAWDVASEPDGPVVVVATAEDRAGNRSEARLTVVVDNTGPSVAIASPRSGFLRAPVHFVGTVQDEHLASFTLEIADGVPGTAYRWSPLAQGTQPVLEGTLADLVSLPADGLYAMRLVAVDLAGNRTEDMVGVEVDTKPPRSPIGLVAAVQRPRSVALQWMASPDTDVAGYRVLRGTSTGALLPIGPQINSVTTIDADVSDGAYRYAVVAVDGAGNESAPSGEASAEIDTRPPTAILLQPRGGVRLGGAVAVVGTASSPRDFREWRLTVGKGALPAATTLLASSPSPVVSGPLGSLDTALMEQGSLYSLLLEAEDLLGNVGRTSVTFEVDNLAPSAPVLLSASSTGSNVLLAWAPNSEPDLAGYLVYRNGLLVEAPGGRALADLGFHVPSGTTTFTDVGLPDGSFTYQVQAIDTARNPSALSNGLEVAIDLHPPSATVVSPGNLIRVAAPTMIFAEAADLDVASLHFEVRSGGPDFAPVGLPFAQPPYVVELDPSQFPSPILEVRAVATDLAGQVDPRPQSTFLFVAPALAEPQLAALVDGATVTASWSTGDPSSSLAGYELLRDGVSLLPAPMVLTGSATASSTTGGTPSAGFDGLPGTGWVTSSAVPQSWEVLLDRPALIDQLDVMLGQAATYDVLARVEGTWVTLARGTTGSAGSLSAVASTVPGLQVDGVRLAFIAAPGVVDLREVVLHETALLVASPHADVGLSPATYRYEVRARGPFGQASSAAAMARVYAPVIAAPTSPTGNGSVELAVSEVTPGATVEVRRQGTPVASAMAGADGNAVVAVPLVPGDNALVVLATDALGNHSLPSAPARILYDPPPAVTVSLALAGVSGRAVSLAYEVVGDAASVATFEVRRATGTAVTSVAAIPGSARTFTDPSAPNGTNLYTVVPRNAHDVEGTPSNAIAASVQVAPPSAPQGLTVSVSPDGGALVLAWAHPGGVAGFLVERSGVATGVFTALNATQLASATSFVDAAVGEGESYTYRVRAVDATGSQSDPSNLATATLMRSRPLAAPVIQSPTVTAVPIAVSQETVTVGGLAPEGTTVRIERNGEAVGLGRVTGFAAARRSLVTTHSAQSHIGASADGSVLAYTEWVPSQATTDLAVEDLGRGMSALIHVPGVSFSGRPAVSPDGRRVAVQGSPTSGSGSIRIYMGAIDGTTLEPLLPADLGDELDPAWSPDSSRVAFGARRGGADVVAWADTVARVEHTLDAGTASVYAPAWQDDGGIVAILSPLDWTEPMAVVRFERDTGQRTVLFKEAEIDGPPVPAANGARLAVVVWFPNGNGDVVVVDGSTGAANRMTSGPLEHSAPALSPDGRLLAYRSGTAIDLQELDTGVERELLTSTFWPGLTWTRTGGLLLDDRGSVESLSWGGNFQVSGVRLVPGGNYIVAVAGDAWRNSSASSEPISVAFDSAGLADLTATVVLQPAVPIAGQSAQALVTVRNVGQAAAASPTVAGAIIPSGGVPQPRTVEVAGNIQPGGEMVAVVPLDVAGLSGSQDLWVEVDPAGLIPDANRANNVVRLQFTVATSSAPTVAVTVTPTSIQAEGTAMASAQVANPGLPQEVTVRMFLEDLGGMTVLEGGLPEPLGILASGASARVTRPIAVGKTLAGSYRVVAEARSSGSIVARASAPVAIEPDRVASLGLVSNRASYRWGEAVTLVASLRNNSTNAVLEGAQGTIVVTDEAGAVRLQQATVLPALGLGGASTFGAQSPPPGLPPGSYLAVATVTLGGAELARAVTSFTVLGAPQLVASLSIAGTASPSPSVRRGDPATLDYAVTNIGTVASMIPAMRVDVIDPQLAAPVATIAALAGPLAPGASFTGTLVLPTSALLRNLYGLTLTADHDGVTGDTLASARLQVLDATVPLLTIANLTPGMYVQGIVTPRVAAADAEPGVARILLSVDGGAPVPLTLESGSAQAGYWSAAVALTDGPHRFVFSAADGDGNDGALAPTLGNPVAASIVSDTTSPALAIRGVLEGAAYALPVTPMVDASDANLASVEVLLNGAPFLTGSAIATDGRHLLSVRATDRSGNQSTASVRFIVDQTPPAIQLYGFADGEIRAADVTPLFTVGDANLAAVDASLDGAAFVSGTPVTTEGRHLLAVAATDVAGNRSEVTASFTINRTPPVITVSGVTDGSIGNAVVVPSVSATGQAPLTVTGTLNGVAFVSGTPVTADGDYLLVVFAVDGSGLRSERSVAFTVDRTAPVVKVAGVVDGSYSATDVTLNYTVDELHPDRDEATIDLLPFVAGVPVSSEGFHVFHVVATDRAGNQTEQTRSFTIDRTAPQVSFSGVTEGQVSPLALRPTVTFSDDNLAASTITMDGQPFVPGTIVGAEGDYRLSATAADKAGNTTSGTVTFAIDASPPVIGVSGVLDGATYASSVSPAVLVTDSHPGTAAVTLDGVTFVSGTTVTADGAHLLSVHAVDAAGNAADATVHFTVVTSQPSVHQRASGRFARTLVLIRSGFCATAAADVARLTDFLISAIGGPERVLSVTTDESNFLAQLRSGLFNVFVVAALPLRANQAFDGCGEQLEGCDDLVTDLPAVLTRKAIAREITELVFSGHAGLIGIRARPELIPKYWSVLGVNPGAFVWGTGVRFTGSPYLPSPDLVLSRRGVQLYLAGATEAGVYRPAPLFGSDTAIAVHNYGLGRSVTFGFDPSVGSSATDAAEAVRRAVGWVLPADERHPLAVVGVEINLAPGTGTTTLVEHVPTPLAIAGSLPDGTVASGGESINWTVSLSPTTETSVLLLARLPDAIGSFALTAERQPASGPPSVFSLDNAETGADLLANARQATAQLPAGGIDGLLRWFIESSLDDIAGRQVNSRADTNANLVDLSIAVLSVRLVSTVDATAPRLALDELIRYWEARWWLTP